MDMLTALEGFARTGSMDPIHRFLADFDAENARIDAAKTEVVAWITETGKVALSQPKTPADAADFAACLIADGKPGVEVLAR